jgi:predicted phosphodiesterase
MRVAALYDIHGNLPALEAVLDELHRESVDLVVVGGDVFPGPMAGEALDLLLALDLPVRFIHGNGDRVTLDMAEGRTTDTIPEAGRPMIRWAAGRLRSEHRQVVASWPGTIRIDIDALGEVLFCHATPRNDREIFTRLTPDDRLRPVFANVRGRLVVCGHTHMQFDRWIDDLRVVNAGSVGMPFGEPGAYWLLLGPGVHLRRTVYDAAAAVDRIRATAYPQADEFANGSILQPPSEETMLELFAGSELK